MIENYKKLHNGVITQVMRKPLDSYYGYDYSSAYDKIGESSTRMAYLRLGHLLGTIGHIPTTLIDIGYGNADFLKVANKCIPVCYGSDVTSEYPLPENIQFIPLDNLYNNIFDVVCMFDVLEHFDDIYDIKKLNAKYIYISVPNCQYISDEWFLNWKHRRPDEHLWFFDEQSIKNFFSELGYKCISISYIEDIIRTDNDNKPNILSGIFQRNNDV
jgi:hypothetical protein